MKLLTVWHFLNGQCNRMSHFASLMVLCSVPKSYRTQLQDNWLHREPFRLYRNQYTFCNSEMYFQGEGCNKTTSHCFKGFLESMISSTT